MNNLIYFFSTFFFSILCIIILVKLWKPKQQAVLTSGRFLSFLCLQKSSFDLARSTAGLAENNLINGLTQFFIVLFIASIINVLFVIITFKILEYILPKEESILILIAIIGFGLCFCLNDFIYVLLQTALMAEHIQVIP